MPLPTQLEILKSRLNRALLFIGQFSVFGALNYSA
jgi:hypothetical protein